MGSGRSTHSLGTWLLSWDLDRLASRSSRVTIGIVDELISGGEEGGGHTYIHDLRFRKTKECWTADRILSSYNKLVWVARL